MDDPVAGDQLKSIIERIERLEEEKKTIADDIKEVYAEAKGNGYDVKVLRKVIAIRTMDANERAEFEAMLDLYLQAVGDLADTPLGRAAAPGFSSRAAMIRAVPSYPERVSRPAAIAAPDLSTAAQSEGAAGASPEQEASESADRDGDTIVAAQDAEFVMLSGAGEGLAGSADPAPAADVKPLFTLPPAKPMRPNCLKPQACGGYGMKHCGTCERAAKAPAEAGADLPAGLLLKTSPITAAGDRA